MDSRRFDSLARTLGSGQSRRGMLKTVAGGAITVISATVGVTQASAAVTKRSMGVVCSKNADCESANCLTKDRTGRRVCGCNSPDLQTDSANCGSCGNVCPGDNCFRPACGAGACFTIFSGDGSCLL